MNYRIETNESFEVFGMERVFRSDEGGDAPNTPAHFWQQCHADIQPPLSPSKINVFDGN